MNEMPLCCSRQLDRKHRSCCLVPRNNDRWLPDPLTHSETQRIVQKFTPPCICEEIWIKHPRPIKCKHGLHMPLLRATYTCIPVLHTCVRPESNYWHRVTIAIHISTEISKTSHPRQLNFLPLVWNA